MYGLVSGRFFSFFLATTLTEKKHADLSLRILMFSFINLKTLASVFKFIKENINILRDKSACFFSVNVVARKKEKNLPETNPYIIKFLKQTQWVPSYIGVFAGKVEYPKYGFFDKYTIRFIMWLTNGPTDITQSYEFTDWKAVENFSSLISS